MAEVCVPWVHLDKKFCMVAMQDTASVAVNEEEYTPISNDV